MNGPHFTNNTHSTSISECYHCHESLPAYSTVYAEVAGQERAFCCHGCQAAALYIESANLTDFYKRRDRFGSQAVTAPVQTRVDWGFLDIRESSGDYVDHRSNGEWSLLIQAQGLYCASCAWLIERAVQQTDANLSARVDVQSRVITLHGKTLGAKPSLALEAIENLGYQPVLLDQNGISPQAVARDDSRQALKRIAIAGLGMMQVMTYMVAVYLGEFQGMEASFHRFLTLVSMMIATLVVFYSGRPFFANALRDVSRGQAGMDVPIALAIAGAYFPSVWITLNKLPEPIYFDSAVMFIFFLSVGRFVEARAKARLLPPADQLASLIAPKLSVIRAGEKCLVAREELQAGDQIKLQKGQCLPFDGVIREGEATFNESMITGESNPIHHQLGERVRAGSVLLDDAVSVQATHSWHDSSIAQISKLLQRARGGEQNQVGWFDYLARHFVMFVLVVTTLVAVIWWLIDPAQVFEIVLAMLVASCPCAFALAAPLGVSAASRAARQRDLLITDFSVLRRVQKVNSWVFDKTGTLTLGRPQIIDIELFNGYSSETVCWIAASLQQQQSHVLSSAFTSHKALAKLSNLESVVGSGVMAQIDEDWFYLGKPSWVQQVSGVESPLPVSKDTNTMVALARKGQAGPQWLGLFYIQDTLRPKSKQAVASLQSLGQRVQVFSGDHQLAAQNSLKALSLNKIIGDLSPQQKVDRLSQLKINGDVVAMVGDGVNDAPILSQADVSIAMASGSELSQSQADVVLLNGRLDHLPSLLDIANQTSSITRQNMIWALAYNALILPFAALGFITPWLAALGMSVSSLIVVLNALRISWK